MMAGNEMNTPPDSTNSKNVLLRLSVALSLLVFATYSRVIYNGFIPVFDDDVYVVNNLEVLNGISIKGILWALTSFEGGNWNPLTWLSHMADVQLFGLNPAGHHLTSLLLHTINTLLVLVTFNKLTGAVWRSAAIAAFFGLHPLHVESVAWIAERKDLISTLFGLLTLLWYCRYVQQRTIANYAGTAIFFLLSLMAKPMLVTIPFIMLLLDYWPLNRCSIKYEMATVRHFHIPVVILDKMPFLIISVIVGTITIMAQDYQGALSGLDSNPLLVSVQNAVVSYAAYLWKTVFPVGLSPFYPQTDDRIVAWKVLLSSGVLVIVSVWVILQRKKRPYNVTGWCLYLVTLLPVIGIVRVGYHAMADRYTYFPLLGIFLMTAWTLPSLCQERFGVLHKHLTTLLLCSLSVFIGITWVQIGYWRNTQTLFERALRVTNDNWLAHNNLGVVYMERGELRKAVEHFTMAVSIRPATVEAYCNLGYSYARLGERTEAIAHFSRAIRANPHYVPSYLGFAELFSESGHVAEALQIIEQAIDQNRDFPPLYFKAGGLLSRLGREEEAANSYRKAIFYYPGYYPAYEELSILLLKRGNVEAVNDLCRALAKIDRAAALNLTRKLAQLYGYQGCF